MTFKDIKLQSQIDFILGKEHTVEKVYEVKKFDEVEKLTNRHYNMKGFRDFFEETQNEK